jgi:DHA1 family bicyclomycin/chloramphenicol resistance-like MFS transporter
VFGIRESLPADRRHAGALLGGTASHVGAVFRDPLFVAVFVASCLGSVAFFSYLSMSSFVIQVELGLSTQLFSMLFAMNALAELGGAQLSRLLVRRVGPRRMYLVGQVTGAATGLVLVVATLAGAPLWLFLALLALFLAGIGIGGPNGTVLALTRHGGRAGTASAMMGMAMFTVGGLAVPLIADLVGTTAVTMTSVISAFTLAAAVIALTAVRRLAPKR